MKKAKRKYIIDVCPECKVRENDSSKKKLFKCCFCERYFCKRHIAPRLAMMRSAIEEIKDPVLKDKVYEEWRKKDGHPDWIWTEKYFEKIKIEEERKRERFWEAVGKLKEAKEKEVLKIPTQPLWNVRKTFGIPEKEVSYHPSKKINLRNALIVIGILTIIGLFFFYYFPSNFYSSTTPSSSPKIITNFTLPIFPSQSEEISEPSSLQLCKQNAEKEIETLKIKSPVDFSHKLILTKEFTSIKEAEDFGKKYVTFPFSTICERKSGKIITLIYELRYSHPIESFSGTIDKETIAIYCDENGQVLKTAFIC
jgi:ribosomal protein L37AE/L43A